MWIVEHQYDYNIKHTETCDTELVALLIAAKIILIRLNQEIDFEDAENIALAIQNENYRAAIDIFNAHYYGEETVSVFPQDGAYIKESEIKLMVKNLFRSWNKVIPSIKKVV